MSGQISLGPAEDLRQSVRETLTKLRWSAQRAAAKEVGGVCLLSMVRSTRPGINLDLKLTLASDGRSQRVPLVSDFIETRGRSMWFSDNTWRLSAKAIEFFTENVAAAIEKTRERGVS